MQGKNSVHFEGAGPGNPFRDTRATALHERFIELARPVYFTNDKRSQVKKQLNLHLGSQIIEEKSYQDYS